MNKRCADGARRVSTSTLQGVCDKDHVVLAETCKDRRDVIGDGKTRIKNEIEITSRCGRNQVTISDKRSRVVVIIQSWHYYYYYVVISFYCCSVFQYSLYFHVCIVFLVFNSFYRATACNATHGIAIAILSVRLSVRLLDACTVTKLNNALRIF